MGYKHRVLNGFYWLLITALFVDVIILLHHMAHRNFPGNRYAPLGPVRCKFGLCKRETSKGETLMRLKAQKTLPFDVESFFRREKWDKKLAKRNFVLRKLNKIFRSPPNGTELPYIGISKERHQKSEKENDSDDCTVVRSLPEGSLKLRALYSTYGSGSTWFRYLVELSTGICTGSHYRDNDDYMAGFFGEAVDPVDRKCILIKTTGPNVTRAFERGTFEEAIILVRNPYEAILSSFYKTKYDKDGFINDSVFKTEEWTSFVTDECTRWFFGAMNTCKTIRPSLTIFYEDLVNSTKHQLLRVLNFLEVQPREKRIQCTFNRADRIFKKYTRKGNLTFDPYTKDMKERINARIKSLRRQLAIGNCGDVPEYEVNIPTES
ncbi:WSC domain-containing protein 2 [Holothuria leucospilota]|uniref:WSC domain-containing protein 2 n=1 Tax=Holothuria leucospilota TaxID=206669 RepID=A0A9Q1C1R0_HOLLE|nr:WSC domain-containing protein 2 [Holothuria leucospilota]